MFSNTNLLVGDINKGHIYRAKPDSMHFKESLIEALQDIFGEKSVSKVVKGDFCYRELKINRNQFGNVECLYVTFAADEKQANSPHGSELITSDDN